jgi:hypothetical protein
LKEKKKEQCRIQERKHKLDRRKKRNLMHNHHNHHKIQQLFDQHEPLEFPTNLTQDIEIWNDVCINLMVQLKKDN